MDGRDLLARNIYNKNLKSPKTLDLRDDMSEIMKCGDIKQSLAYVAASMLEWKEKKEIGFEVLFSPEYIYNKLLSSTRGETSNDMDARTIMKMLYKYGSIPETSYSNSDDDEYIACGFRINAYAQIETIEACKNALYKNGPCLITFPMYNKTEKMWIKSDSCKVPGCCDISDSCSIPGCGCDISGVCDISGQGCDGSKGHAMCIVGYNNDSFIVRNTFGKEWGDKGFCYYPFNEWGAHWEIWTCIDENSQKIQFTANCIGNIKTFIGNIKKCFGR